LNEEVYLKFTKIVLSASLLSSCLVLAQSPLDLKTESGNELGLTVSSYSYLEPGLGVSMKAINWGVNYTGTYAFGNDWFVFGNANYNNGQVSYSGTGTQSGIPQYYFDIKGAVGHDFAFEGFNLSLYTGFGYRFLSQQWGGTSTSTGAVAYDRQSTYNYIPLGVTHRYAVSDQAELETTLEYDYLLSGNQHSGLASLNGTRGGTTYKGIPNINNYQNSGYGINLTVMYKKSDWGVGPYIKYWNIQQSNTNYATISVNGAPTRYSAYEPVNNTNEYGIKAIYRF
jgi:hypothetical protein